MLVTPFAPLGKYWASGIGQTAKSLFFKIEKEGRPCIDIAGVASSILATPIIFPRRLDSPI
ncbi:MAG: hypothetical protein H0U83_05200 [Sphingomonas sp.]|nr:hypothetical protein [Sphingomonas sp.]